MGCPTTYDGMNASWTRGKLSRLFSGSVTMGSSSYTYSYNAFGQRVARNYSYLAGTSGVNPPETGQVTAYSKKYFYDHAGRLIAETTTKTLYNVGTSTEKIVFLYDESGIVGMEYSVGNDMNIYYFQRNLQGDVVGIFDTAGGLVAKYDYDAWGNCTISSETTNTSVANANPIRYRGYYYDSDTGLYYCNARYYSPLWRRFISPDDTAYLDPETVNGLNLYCYCNNDPVNYCDPSGHFVLSTFLICLGVGVVAGAGLGALSAAQQGTDIWRGMLTGALLGGMIGAAAGLALAGASGGVAAGVGKAFLKAGTKTIAGKFTADLTAYAAFGKEMGSLESYMSAFVFGGSVGALGLSGFWKGAADIMARPAYSILVDDMLFKGKGWSQEKYWTNVAIRGMTYGLPSDLKPITRGLLNGWYNKYNFAIPSNLAYAI